MTDITCRFIVQKGTMFFQADSRYLFGTDWKPVFSQYVYDAKAFKDEKHAHEKARAIGGRVRIFDALNGELL